MNQSLSQMLAVSASPDTQYDPEALLRRAESAAAFQLLSSHSEDDLLCLEISSGGEVFHAEICPVEFQLPELYRCQHLFPDVDAEAIERARIGLSVEMEFGADPLASYHLQLRLICSLVPELLAVIDDSSEKILSGRWVTLAARSQEIEADRQSLEDEMAAQEEAKAALAEQEATLQAQRSEADAYLIELAAAYDNLTDEYLANEAEEEALRKEIMEAQAAYEAALSAEEAERLAQQNQNNVAGSGSTSNVTPSTSGFISPLPGGAYVTCAYGWRIHPIWGDERFHSGVDLGASQGTPIYAIAAGTVTTATYGDANGYYVSISHGNGYGSVYCHMTNYIVSVGDSVSQGQVIGYVGSTGWSTGPHLHFEIHVNGSTVNPMDYISL